ncbi:hypothetical protein [Paracoccus sp. (in: a-proteobacteria)]|nr:hypothetical protein [Paracoccus sp. (in: a-proteobacteria)]
MTDKTGPETAARTTPDGGAFQTLMHWLLLTAIMTALIGGAAWLF